MKVFYLIAVFLCLNTAYAQEQKKDTLFFYLDNEYVKESKYEKGRFYIDEDTSDSSGYVVIFLKQKKTKTQLNYNKILFLKEFIRKSNFYSIDRSENKLYDEDFAEFLSNYTVFLVDEKCGYINFLEVEPGVEIE